MDRGLIIKAGDKNSRTGKGSSVWRAAEAKTSVPDS